MRVSEPLSSGGLFRLYSLQREGMFGEPLTSNGLPLLLHYSGSQASCHNIYCDMSLERRNSPLLDNGSLEHVSAATDKHGIVQERLEVVISVRFATEVIKDGHVIDSKIHS
jgi:hypothetical protein